MALQIKGSSQIQNESISLNKIANVAAGKILGRSEDESGEGVMSALSGADIRKIAELHSDDAVSFASASLSGALSAASATLSGDLAAADANLSGDLNATGDVGGATATITGNATVGGTLGVTSSISAASASITNAVTAASATLSGDLAAADANLSGDLNATGDVGGATATITGNATVGGTLGVTSSLSAASAAITNAVTAASATLSGNLAAADANLSGDLNATGDVGGATATITGNATVGGTLGVTSSLSAQSASITAAMSSATISTSSDASIGGDLTVSGDLVVNGDSVQVNVSTLQVEDPMIKLGQSNSADSLDLGFYGLYNDGSDKYAGLFRDQSDSGKFKLFDGITSEPTATVADVSSNKATLVATIEGNITFDNARTFSLSGDLSGSQTFDGSGNCDIEATIAANSVEFSMLGCEIDEDDMSSNSASHIPTQQSVKAYVDDQVASAGQSDLEAKDMLMVDSTGAYVKVKEIIEYIEISSANEAEVSIEVEAEFDELSMVFLNGQKLRFSDDAGTSNDYYFENDGSGDFKKLSCDMFEVGDEIEVRYFIKS